MSRSLKGESLPSRSSTLRWKGSKVRSRRQAFYMRPGGGNWPKPVVRYAYGGKPEMKSFDGTATFGTVDAAGEIDDSINEVPQGTDEDERIGRKITIKKIGFRYLALLPNTSDPTQTSDIVRVMVYQDKQANKATATVTGILEAANWRSFNNLANKGRFRVLMDEKITLNSGSGAWDGTNDQFGECRYFGERYLDVNIPIEFDGATGAIGEITSNNVGILAISADGVATLTCFYRIRYFDA